MNKSLISNRYWKLIALFRFHLSFGLTVLLFKPVFHCCDWFTLLQMVLVAHEQEQNLIREAKIDKWKIYIINFGPLKSNFNNIHSHVRTGFSIRSDFPNNTSNRLSASCNWQFNLALLSTFYHFEAISLDLNSTPWGFTKIEHVDDQPSYGNLF